MRTRRLRPAPVLRSAFAGFRFPADVIVLAVRWYLRYGLSYRDVEELLTERGVEVDHVTIYRWVLRFTPLLAAEPRQSGDSSPLFRWGQVAARRYATALVRARSQIPATGIFGDLLQTATLPGPGLACGRRHRPAATVRTCTSPCGGLTGPESCLNSMLRPSLPAWGWPAPPATWATPRSSAPHHPMSVIGTAAGPRSSGPALPRCRSPAPEAGPRSSAPALPRCRSPAPHAGP